MYFLILCPPSHREGIKLNKGSANRAKMQIYLRFSEVRPTFKLRSRLKFVQLTYERARIKLA